jgi:hypothetical protein
VLTHTDQHALQTHPPKAHTNPQPYKGVALGEVWPLQYLDKADLEVEDRELIADIDEFWSDHPQRINATPDLAHAKRYVACCRKKGLLTRILLCSTFQQPCLSETDEQFLKPRCHFLGFDYCFPSCDFSSVEDDLHHHPLAELEPFLRLLNNNGLFQDQDDAEAYIAARWKYAARHPGELEDVPHFLMAKVEEVDATVL